MTRGAVREYAAIQRERYRRASRKQRGRILDEVVAVTGYHRKAAIRLLGTPARATTGRPKAGRPRAYGPAVAEAAGVLWEAAGRSGPKRLQPFVAELADRLGACGELVLDPATDNLLRRASAATLARLLAPARASLPPRGRSTTAVGTGLQHPIPVRTCADWQDTASGFLEVDLVAHCGDSTAGFSVCTLTAVDVASGWVELEAVWGKGQHRVQAAVHELRRRRPVPLRGLDSDTGSEFINQTLWGYCQRDGIVCTRGRADKKNAAAHVEQKNGAVVRPLVGYDRFASQAAYAQLGRVYRLARLHVTFFQPVQKLLSKQRDGAKLTRVFDQARTPYQRLCAAGALAPTPEEQLERLYRSLNPLELRRQIDAELARLWPLAARTSGPDPAPPAPAPVTTTSEASIPPGNRYL